MKNKLLLTLAMCAAGFDARQHRQTHALALGNADVPLTSGAELEALRKENAALKESQAQASADEVLIRQKMAAGLTRPQAVKAVDAAKKFAEANKPLADAAKKARAEAARRK